MTITTCRTCGELYPTFPVENHDRHKASRSHLLAALKAAEARAAEARALLVVGQNVESQT